MKHARTDHGHLCCALCPAGLPPRSTSRCGGPAICKKCALEAAGIHATTTAEPNRITAMLGITTVDLVNLDDGPTTWRVKTWWWPSPGTVFTKLANRDTFFEVTIEEYQEYEPARKQAYSLATLRGVVAVVLIDPYGDTHGHYDRFSNTAVRLSNPLYWCPTSGEIESDTHGGFDKCCSHPELHRPPTPKEIWDARTRAEAAEARSRDASGPDGPTGTQDPPTA